MQSIQDLHDAADKERQKASDLRHEADRNRGKSDNSGDDTQSSLQYLNEAQMNEEKAAQHDQVATKFDAKATDLEAKALELNRQKTEIQNTSQAQIDRLDKEEKKLRGETRGF